MASITLPAFAKEVTLRCKLTDGTTEIWGFDEANKTVTSEQKKFSVTSEPISTAPNKDVESYEYYPKRKYFITPTEFGFWKYNHKGELTGTFTISRMDGDYRWARGSFVDTGTCVPFKQAF